MKSHHPFWFLCTSQQNKHVKSAQCHQSTSPSLLWFWTKGLESVLLSNCTSKEMSFPSWEELVTALLGLLRLRYIMVWIEVRSSHSSSQVSTGNSQRTRERPGSVTSTLSPFTLSVISQSVSSSKASGWTAEESLIKTFPLDLTALKKVNQRLGSSFPLQHKKEDNKFTYLLK